MGHYTQTGVLEKPTVSGLTITQFGESGTSASNSGQKKCISENIVDEAATENEQVDKPGDIRLSNNSEKTQECKDKIKMGPAQKGKFNMCLRGLSMYHGLG